jgi:type II secretory pathway component GspD/PulD (secretin)
MRTLLCCAALLTLTGALAAGDDKPDDSEKAAKTRKLLKTKITVEFKDEKLSDVVDELKEQVKGLKFLIDTAGGVSRNRTITYKAKDKTVEQVLDEMLKKPALGYIVISKKGNAYDGLVQIRNSDERGYEKKKK